MTPPRWLFFPTPQGSGGSDWDTYAVSVSFDPSFDTSSARTPTDTSALLDSIYPISGYTGTYPYTCGYVRAHRGRVRSNVLASGPNSRGAYQGAYGAPTNYTWPPYIAVFELENTKNGQYNPLTTKGWTVMGIENTVGAYQSNYATYTSPEYSKDGSGEGLRVLGAAVIVALSDYDGNAANWRDYDGMTLVQHVRYTTDSSSNLTVVNVGTPTKNVIALNPGSSSLHVWDTSAGKPRMWMGSEALNFTDADAGTPVQRGTTDSYQYTGGTGTQNGAASKKYFKSFPWYGTYTTEITNPGYSIGAFHFKGNSTQPAYMNASSHGGFTTANIQRDLYIFDQTPTSI